jgi:hypothetical protein
MLVLPAVHLNLLNPVPDLMTSRPHDTPSVPIPAAPSKRPTSFPQAYPALKLIAENTSTTPAEIIQDISVGEMMVSSVPEPDRTALRLFFVFRSLLCSRAFRLAVAACFGDDGGLAEDPETGAGG